jgi:hypothetical protein
MLSKDTLISELNEEPTKENGVEWSTGFTEFGKTK